MSTIEIRKAERRRSKLRLALAGPSGAGKTMSSLKLAKGIGGKVCMIDTERGSGDFYADLYDYDIITLEPPYKPEKYVEAIQAAEAAGYDVIILDSLSHAWTDEGGLLDQADKLQGSGTNRFNVWAKLTPQHRSLVNAMLNSPAHIIATMRSKQEYALEQDDKGKNSVRKLGMAPVQRDGMEYEFTVFMDIDQGHHARASKDRTNLFNNEVFVIDESVGKRILDWLNEGKTDTRAMKREVLQHFERLELGMPDDPEDRVEFIRVAVERLTGLAWKEKNLEQIAPAMRSIQDKKKAYDAVWESPQSTESDASTHNEEKDEDAPETPAEANTAPKTTSNKKAA